MFYDIEDEESISDMYFESVESAKRYADSVQLEDNEVSGYSVLGFANGEEYVRTH